jgi:hypothetical protein
LAQVEFSKDFPAAKEIKVFDNASFRLVYYSEPEVNTYRDRMVVSKKNISAIALNPTGSSLAVIQKDKIFIYSFLHVSEKLFEFKYPSELGKKPKRFPVALAYSKDARNLLVSFSSGEIVVFDTREYKMQYVLRNDDVPANSLYISQNNYFVAAVKGSDIDIWNFEAKTVRKKIKMDKPVNGIAFSPDGSMMAATSVNKLYIFNTRDWEIMQSYDAKGNESFTSPSFGADDKYLAFVHDTTKIAILNVRKKDITQEIAEKEAVKSLSFLREEASNKEYIISIRPKSVVYWNANGLNPFYGKIINQEVDKKMNEWVKMMQDETMEDYKIRVNEENRAKQMEVFMQEAATSLAGDRIAIENPFVGEYNNESNLLAINFTSLPPIGIAVPSSELADFGDNSKLKFNNAVYMLNDEDEFVLAYIEVTNEVNNKVYIYDNIGRTRLTAIETDVNFVPLEILQIANQEEINLQTVKEDIVEQSKQENLITENTQINVKTEVVADVDADGNKIFNYLVDYQYEVINKEFSEKEDFPPGAYNIQRSNAAMSLMKIIKSSFEEGDFAKYMKDGKRVKITITGSADGTPIRGKIPYSGIYGDFTDEPYRQNNELNAMTVTKTTGITQNPQLAFIRAVSVKDYLENNISTLQNTQNDFNFNIEVSEERGGEFRRIDIKFTIINAFEQ